MVESLDNGIVFFTEIGLRLVLTLDNILWINSFFVFVFFLNTPMTKVLDKSMGMFPYRLDRLLPWVNLQVQICQTMHPALPIWVRAFHFHTFILLSKNWKFIVNLSGQRNPINTKCIWNHFSQLQKYTKDLPLVSDPFNPPSQTNYAIYPNWHFDKKNPWLMGAFQIGVFKQYLLFQGRTKYHQP